MRVSCPLPSDIQPPQSPSFTLSSSSSHDFQLSINKCTDQLSHRCHQYGVPSHGTKTLMQRRAEGARVAVLYNDRLAPLLYIFLCLCVLCLTFSFSSHLFAPLFSPTRRRPSVSNCSRPINSINHPGTLCVCLLSRFPCSVFLFHFFSSPLLVSLITFSFCLSIQAPLYNIYTIAPFTISPPLFSLTIPHFISSICSLLMGIAADFPGSFFGPFSVFCVPLFFRYDRIPRICYLYNFPLPNTFGDAYLLDQTKTPSQRPVCVTTYRARP